MPSSANLTSFAVLLDDLDAAAKICSFSFKAWLSLAASADNSLIADCGIFCFFAADNLSAAAVYAFLAEAKFFVAEVSSLDAFLSADFASDLNFSYSFNVCLDNSRDDFAFRRPAS